MSNVTVSISLTQKQQGALYMQNEKRGERIKQFRAGLKHIIELAEAAGPSADMFQIATAAKALLEVPKAAP